MSKLYIGNLSPDVSQELLCRELGDLSIDVQNIVLNKRGFAFIDCNDQVALDKAIEKLSGLKINGKEISVEHSVPRTSRTRKVQIRNIPSTMNWEDLDSLLSKFGRTDSCEQVSTDTEHATVNVVYASRQEALAAVRELNGYILKDQIIKCSFLPDTHDTERTHRARPSASTVENPFGFGNRGAPDTPLRMLVPASVVGAIIGKGGSTVRQITQLKDSRARVDVHRREGPGSDKVATIFGAPEACGAAAVRILEIVRKEDKDISLPLRILAHNALIGRLIGRDGRNLKLIQDKTGARIGISSMHDLSPYNLDRTISIHGEIKGISEAEQMISEKLRQYETDMASMSQQSLYPGLNPNQMQMFPGLHQNNIPTGYPLTYSAEVLGGNQPANQTTQETVTLLVPSGSVGAIIGSRGSHIRNISRIAGASIRIHPPDEEGAEGEPKNIEDKDIQVADENGEPVNKHQDNTKDSESDAKAKVTIVGLPEAQWKAQFCIFDKLKQEGWFGNEEGRLTTQITIPGQLVGRVIGKGGVNVRELQRLTSSEVTIPRQGEIMSAEEIPVSITGTFFSNQSAQRKIRELVGRELQRQR